MGTCATGQKPTKSGRRLSSQMSGGDGGGGYPDAGPRVADGADGADGMFESACILMILLPARPSRLNVMSMPRTRRNVCARRRRPASALGFLGQPVLSLEMPPPLRSAPAPQKVGGAPRPRAALGHDLPHASSDRVGVNSGRAAWNSTSSSLMTHLSRARWTARLGHGAAELSDSRLGLKAS